MAEQRGKQRSVGRWIALAVLLLALALLLAWWRGGLRSVRDGVPDLAGKGRHAAGAGPGAGTGSSQTDTGAAVGFVDTILAARLRDSGAAAAAVDSARAAAVRRDSLRRARGEHGRLGGRPSSDSLPKSADSASSVAAGDSARSDSVQAVVDPCSQDSLLPWVYPDPSGGLHRQTVTVVLVPNKPCTVHWRRGGEVGWSEYRGDTIVIDQSGSIEYKAVDSCGKAMDVRQESYEIDRTAVRVRCAAGMEYVSIGTAVFCIDKYEWPNRRGARPTTRVSIYQAMDSCLLAGKRLCTTEEWKVACAGPYSWAYPYGQRYEPRACVTNDTSARPAGSRPECRGYFGLFDMSGNVLEWTNTRAKANSAFYNVLGGFWESGPQSGCFSERYSYFPQNRHNPVGFRCCGDTLAGQK